MSKAGPLDGIRVVEAGQLIAGPFCGQLLGDFGAEVIKVEEPTNGDPMRRWGDGIGGVGGVDDQALAFSVIGRNKRSVTCDLRTPDGQQLMRDLVATADILVENFRPGTLERWGLAPDTLLALYPRLVVTRVSAYGQTGPYADRAGYGSIGEAMGGLRYVTGYPDRPPSRVGVSIGDSLAGTFAALGSVMALRVAEKTGRGQIVDSAIYEAVLAMMESVIPEYALLGQTRERTGSVLPNVAPSNAYPTRDAQDVLIAANQDTVFTRLARAMGREELTQHDDYSTHLARGRHQEELDQLIASWTATFEREALLELLHQHGVPAGSVYTAREMLADEHFRAREAIIEVTAGGAPFPMQNAFPRLSETPGSVKRIAPRLGQDTESVLRDDLGKTDEEIAKLRAAQVI